MMMLSWMHSSIRQPPGAHCSRKRKGKSGHVAPVQQGKRVLTWGESTGRVKYNYLFHSERMENVDIVSWTSNKPRVQKLELRTSYRFRISHI